MGTENLGNNFLDELTSEEKATFMTAFPDIFVFNNISLKPSIILNNIKNCHNFADLILTSAVLPKSNNVSNYIPIPSILAIQGTGVQYVKYTVPDYIRTLIENKDTKMLKSSFVTKPKFIYNTKVLDTVHDVYSNSHIVNPNKNIDNLLDPTNNIETYILVEKGINQIKILTDVIKARSKIEQAIFMKFRSAFIDTGKTSVEDINKSGYYFTNLTNQVSADFIFTLATYIVDYSAICKANFYKYLFIQPKDNQKYTVETDREKLNVFTKRMTILTARLISDLLYKGIIRVENYLGEGNVLTDDDAFVKALLESNELGIPYLMYLNHLITDSPPRLSKEIVDKLKIDFITTFIAFDYIVKWIVDITGTKLVASNDLVKLNEYFYASAIEKYMVLIETIKHRINGAEFKSQDALYKFLKPRLKNDRNLTDLLVYIMHKNVRDSRQLFVDNIMKINKQVDDEYMQVYKNLLNRIIKDYLMNLEDGEIYVNRESTVCKSSNTDQEVVKYINTCINPNGNKPIETCIKRSLLKLDNSSIKDVILQEDSNLDRKQEEYSKSTLNLNKNLGEDFIRQLINTSVECGLLKYGNINDKAPYEDPRDLTDMVYICTVDTEMNDIVRVDVKFINIPTIDLFMVNRLELIHIVEVLENSLADKAFTELMDIRKYGERDFNNSDNRKLFSKKITETFKESNMAQDYVKMNTHIYDVLLPKGDNGYGITKVKVQIDEPLLMTAKNLLNNANEFDEIDKRMTYIMNAKDMPSDVKEKEIAQLKKRRNNLLDNTSDASKYPTDIFLGYSITFRKSSLGAWLDVVTKKVSESKTKVYTSTTWNIGSKNEVYTSGMNEQEIIDCSWD